MTRRDPRRRSSRSKSRGDDLTTVTKVRPAVADWLQDTFGVRTFAELANLSADAIRKAAQTSERRLSRVKIRIRVPARELAGKTNSKSPRKEASMAEPRRPAKLQKASTEWQEFASFIVYFERKMQGGVEQQRTTVEQRTAIHHLETSEQSKWQGLAALQACEWMISKLPAQDQPGAELETPDQEVPAVATSDHDRTVVFGTIDRIRCFQPPDHPVPQDLHGDDTSMTAYLAASTRVTFEAAFTVRRVAGAEAAGLVRCQVEFRATDLQTSTVTLLGVIPVRVEAEQSDAVARLTAVGLPEGNYSLQVTVTALDGATGTWQTEVPLLQVM
jgi:primosomal protein N''